jgi:molybdate transport system substrate-binding protein
MQHPYSPSVGPSWAMRILKLMIAGVAGLVALGNGQPTQAEILRVGAPPSLRAAFEEIVPLFEHEYGVAVTTVYTPSKTLLREIEHGAAIDVLLSAGVEEIESLYKKGLTLNGPPQVFAQTSLVLVMSADSKETSLSLPEALSSHTTRIALGNPETSYLGQITARELSKHYPMYKRHSHLLYASHSEDILHIIQTGKADVGLVYRANLINTGYVRISDETPIGSEVPIQFGEAVVSNCRASVRALAKQFSSFLMTPRIQFLLVKYGFITSAFPDRRYARQARSPVPVP